MSAAIQNYDREIFPAPDSFDPFRWLGPDSTTSGPNGDLDKYMVTFSKGTRQCGGINLAWMEMYLALSTLVMRFKIKGEMEKGKELVQKDFFVGILQVSNPTRIKQTSTCVRVLILEKSDEYKILFERRRD